MEVADWVKRRHLSSWWIDFPTTGFNNRFHQNLFLVALASYLYTTQDTSSYFYYFTSTSFCQIHPLHSLSTFCLTVFMLIWWLFSKWFTHWICIWLVFFFLVFGWTDDWCNMNFWRIFLLVIVMMHTKFVKHTLSKYSYQTLKIVSTCNRSDAWVVQGSVIQRSSHGSTSCMNMLLDTSNSCC